MTVVYILEFRKTDEQPWNVWAIYKSRPGANKDARVLSGIGLLNQVRTYQLKD